MYIFLVSQNTGWCKCTWGSVNHIVERPVVVIYFVLVPSKLSSIFLIRNFGFALWVWQTANGGFPFPRHGCCCFTLASQLPL